MANIVQLQDALIGKLIGLSRATENNEQLISDSTNYALLKGLCARTSDEISEAIKLLEEEKRKLVPNCFTCASPCGRTSDYDMQELLNEAEESRTLKYAILFGIKGLASYVYPAAIQGSSMTEVYDLFYKALFMIGWKGWKKENLLAAIEEIGEMYLKTS